MFSPIPHGLSRIQYWSSFINQRSLSTVAEVGVWKGEFASGILSTCPFVDCYYLIDPWEKLNDWNKPFNFKEDLDIVYTQAINSLSQFQHKTRVLRGKTIDVIQSIPDHSLDFAYIDGDHTLRGISIDLISILPKMKSGSFIGLDDFSHPLQHGLNFELSLVDPFALYFSEAHSFPCARLGKGQFCIYVKPDSHFSFTDYVQPNRSSPYPDIISRLMESSIFKEARDIED